MELSRLARSWLRLRASSAEDAQPEGAASAVVPNRFRAGEFALFAGSVAAFQGSRLLVTFVATTTLQPADFALWGLFITALAYSSYASLGLINGANRTLPIAIGARDHASVEDIEGNALFGAVAAGIAAFAVAVASLAGTGLGIAILVAATMLAQQLYLFGQVSLRSRLDFNRASLQQIVISVAFVAVGLVTLSSGLAGLLSAQLTAYLLGATLAIVLWRRHLRPRLRLETVVSLVKTGLPIMAAGITYAAMTTVDRWLASLRLPAEDAAQYLLAALIASGVLMISVITGQHTYPRMAIRYGETASGRALLPMATRQSLLAAALIVLLGVTAFIGSNLLVALLAPEYVGSIGVLGLLLVGGLPLSLAAGYANVLLTIGRGATYLLLQLGGLLVHATLGAAAVYAGAGPVGLAIAAVVAYTAFSVAVVILTVRAVHRGAR